MFWLRRKKFVGSYALELDQALVVAGAVRLTHAVGSLIAEFRYTRSPACGCIASKKSRAQAMWRSASGSSSVQTALMFTLWAAPRWLKAVSPSAATEGAAELEDDAVHDFGGVGADRVLDEACQSERR